MKQVFLLFAAAMGLMVAISTGVAQDQAEAAAAIAARQDADDRYQRLTASVQELQAANAGLQKRLGALTDELQKVREESARNGANHATHEDLNRLAEKLREVDQKRDADNRRILETLEKLAKTPLPSVPAANGENGPSGKQKSEPRQIEKGYWYEVKREDKLSVIVQEYRKKGVKVTLQQVKDANPDVSPNRLLVGQKIWIPDASAK